MWSCDLIHSCAHTLALDGGVQKLICCSSLLFSFVLKGIISFDGVSIEVCKVRSSVFVCVLIQIYTSLQLCLLLVGVSIYSYAFISPLMIVICFSLMKTFIFIFCFFFPEVVLNLLGPVGEENMRFYPSNGKPFLHQMESSVKGVSSF